MIWIFRPINGVYRPNNFKAIKSVDFVQMAQISLSLVESLSMYRRPVNPFGTKGRFRGKIGWLYCFKASANHKTELYLMHRLRKSLHYFYWFSVTHPDSGAWLIRLRITKRPPHFYGVTGAKCRGIRADPCFCRSPGIEVAAFRGGGADKPRKVKTAANRHRYGGS